MTVTTSKAKYDNCKKNTVDATNKVSTLSYLWLLLSTVIFFLLVVALMGVIEPPIVQIANAVLNK